MDSKIYPEFIAMRKAYDALFVPAPPVKKMHPDADKWVALMRNNPCDDTNRYVGRGFDIMESPQGWFAVNSSEMVCHGYLHSYNIQKYCHAYVSHQEQASDEERAAYFKWLTEESPWYWGLEPLPDYRYGVVARKGMSGCLIAAVLSPARLFSEPKNRYPSWETIKHYEQRGWPWLMTMIGHHLSSGTWNKADRYKNAHAIIDTSALNPTMLRNIITKNPDLRIEHNFSYGRKYWGVNSRIWAYDLNGEITPNNTNLFRDAVIKTAKKLTKEENAKTLAKPYFSPFVIENKLDESETFDRHIFERAVASVLANWMENVEC